MLKRSNTRGVSVVTIFLGTFLFFIGLAAILFKPSSLSETKQILIPSGASLKEASQILFGEGVISHPFVFKILLKMTRGSSKLRAGEFRFDKEISLMGVLSVLYESEPITYPISVPEGYTIKLIAQKLSELNLADKQKFISLGFDSQMVQKYRLKSPSLEGFLFPDTYRFSKVDGEEKILDKMVVSLLDRFERKYKAEAVSKGFSFERLITLASIVEKETGDPSERPLIASVFLNRLKKGMRLQSDPTTIYGIQDFKGNLTKNDLRRETPYNTYAIKGLPVGPISSPGEAAIIAVLRPVVSDFLFFVSKNDGTHVFSKTYKDHINWVNTFQKRSPSSHKQKATNEKKKTRK